MKIAILSSGRYHVCDLARELDALGHDVAFYSLVPPWRTARYGLPHRCTRWLGPVLAPLYLVRRVAERSAWADMTNHLLTSALDEVAAKLIAQCDVFIGMSGMSMKTAESVRRKYGARIWIERGSKHIVAQRQILASMGSGSQRVPDWAVKRETEEYELADLIVVPARHAAETFVKHGISEEKLFINPYGVDLTMFPPTVKAASRVDRTVINVGAWSLQKGADVLAESIKTMNDTRLLHVGAIGDVAFPSGDRFTHEEPVPQYELRKAYARADIFSLPSRQDGLALVLLQALACGLPIVCSEHTGGEDLIPLVGDEFIRLVPADNKDALVTALEAAFRLVRNTTATRDILGSSRENLSWRAYGRRYDHKLSTIS